jgi:5-methylcytosine-specific restriction endonuclease McrA
MKEWAKGFYKSTAWDETRAAYLSSQHCLCERCGEPAKVVHHRTYITKDNINNPYITLNWENLEAVCQDCHNREHHANERRRTYRFDADGNLTQ